MRRLFIPPAAVLALFITALMTLGPWVQAGTVAEDVVAPSFIVSTDGGTGSGVLLDLGGRKVILTAAHVVEDARLERHGREYWSAITVEWRAGATGRVRQTAHAHVLAYTDPESGPDLALLATDAPLDVRASRVLPEGDTVTGEEVWYCGYGSGVPWNLQRGVVSIPAHPHGGRDWLAVTGNGWYGHSGSGVYVKRGEERFVVGVVSRASSNRYPDKAPVLCVHVTEIRKFLSVYQEKK